MDSKPAESRLPRFSKGRRPEFYPIEGLDEAMSMILTLASEFNVMRDRLDTIERIAAKKGVILEDEIENFVADEECQTSRSQRRDEFLQRLYYVSLKRVEEQALGQSEDRYFTDLERIAKGDI